MSVNCYAQTSLAPSLYRVTGLKNGEPLNVRSGPSTKFEDIGDLTIDSDPVEIIELDSTGKWARFVWSGSSGWASIKYLKQFDSPKLAGTEVPVGLYCTGTEPFWKYEILDQKNIRLNILGNDKPISALLDTVSSSVNHLTFPVAIVASTNSESITSLLRPDRCSDGMSDRIFDWSVDILLQRNTSTTLLSGCCRLPIQSSMVD